MIAERAAFPPALGYRWLGFQSGLACGGPCTDHMGVSTAALRYMLIQTRLRGDVNPNAIVLFPSWPCNDWAVHFRLHAPGKTVVEGRYDGNGTLSDFEVTPISRRADVRFHACVDEVRTK